MDGSTVPRRWLGRELRRLREEAGLTRDAVARELEWSTPRLWRIEKGMVPVRSVDVRLMCEMYRADGPTTTALMGLAKETKSKGWYHAYGDTVPAYFELYLGFESAASRIRLYEPELVPGLLQTKEYARQVFEIGLPGASSEEIERALSVRMKRQRILSRPVRSLQVDVILNEAVLMRADAEQLRHLAQATARKNVNVRILPFAAGLHYASMASGSFAILDFPLDPRGEPTEPTTVYTDSLTGALYLDKPSEVEAYTQLWDGACSDCLSARQSKALLLQRADEVEGS